MTRILYKMQTTLQICHINKNTQENSIKTAVHVMPKILFQIENPISAYNY